MAAVPSIGRAVRVEGAAAPEADLTHALYEQYANQILRYCVRELGSREEAEDAVQSTFLNAFRGIQRGVVPELESAWLFKIAHNVCLSRRRTSWRRGRIESPTDFDVVQELTPAPSRGVDELIGLQDVLEQMPENQRRAILLREWQGLSYREIAEELELSQGAVETLIFRARRALAAGLEQPPEPKRRIARGTDMGNVLAGLKSLLLGGGAAAKVAATVAVVSASTVVAAAPVQQHRAHSHAAPKPAARTPASRTPAAPSRPAANVAGPAAAFPAKTATHAHAPPRRAAIAFPQIAGSATPAAASVEAQPATDTTPPAVEPGPQPVSPASEPAEALPADTGHPEPQHAPAASPGAPPSDSKGSDAEQRKSTSVVGGTTTAVPVVASPATVAAPIQPVQTTTGQPPVNQSPTPTSPVQPSPSTEKVVSDTKARPPIVPAPVPISALPPAPVSAPAPVVAPPSVVTLPAPVLSSSKA